MTRIRWLLLFLLVSTPAFAQVEVPCLQVAWDFATHPQLGSFFVYTSQTKGVYPMVQGNPLKSRPAAIVPAIPNILTELSCEKLRMTQPGTWYAIVTAVSKDMTEQSPPSNEITVTVKNQTPVPPHHPPVVPPPPGGAPPPPPQPSVALPPPLPRPARPLVALPPLPSSNSGNLTETCVWLGTCP